MDSTVRKLTLFPIPETVTFHSGFLPASFPLPLQLPAELLDREDALFHSELLPFVKGPSIVIFEENGSFGKEAYQLHIEQYRIRILFSDPAGAFAALVTLGQILRQSHGILPCCSIADRPLFRVRGFLLDISRGKIPTLQTLKKLTDLLAFLKYNQLQLYIEGFSFAYRFFSGGPQGQDAVSASEIRDLSRFCRSRGIDLVPAQNTLGHMSAWLSTGRYCGLAESEGSFFPPSTLNVTDPESSELVRNILDEILDAFESPQINVCLDEPFELGTGKSREAAEAAGRDTLYLNWLTELKSYLAQHGRSMMMWGDIARGNRQLLASIPEDVTILEWGYDRAYPFDRFCAALREAGRRFLVCPGTAGWTTWTGLTDCMIENIRSAGRAAVRYGAEGMLLTDWGDFGHLQPLAVSYPALVLHAAEAWNGTEASEEELASGLDLLLDANGIGRLMLDSGRYDLLEEYSLECKTLAAMPLLWETFGENGTILDIAERFACMAVPEVRERCLASLQDRRPFEEEAIRRYLYAMKRQWTDLSGILPGTEADTVRQEYLAAIDLAVFLTHLRGLLDTGRTEAGLLQQAEALLQPLADTWLMRNRPSGLTAGMELLRRIAAAVSAE